jgi:hypothetical protein
LELTVIELFLKDLSASDRFWLLVVFCLTLVTLTRLVLIDFFVALIQGSKPEKVVEYRTNCDDDASLTGLCLRNPKGRCETTHDCEAAMQGDL